MSLLAVPLGRQAWRFIILGGVFTFLLTVWMIHPSSTSLGSSLVVPSVLDNTRRSTPCSPSLWSAGQWKPIEPRSSSTVQSVADILTLEGFQGCASDREYKWHIAADDDQWDRFPDVASYVWTPPDECNVRPLNPEALVKDLVEKGGWLLIGDSVTENHFFSLSCLLYPHVIATPNYTLNPYWDRAWPQNLYLNPDSPLVSHLNPPSGFNLSVTPLVTFRRVDLMLTQDQLNGLYKTSYPERVRDDSAPFTLFGGDGIWEIEPREVLKIFTAPLPEANYGTLVTSTAGHWTVGTIPALRDEALEDQGMQNVLDLFAAAMPVWADIVQDWLSVEQKLNNGGLTAGGMRREVVVRAYLPGHDGCHNIMHPWETYEQANQKLSYNWGYIPTLNQIFERILSSPKYPNVHFLPIDQPALLRPDAHAGGDCLHLMSGTGVIEGWSHYIWHYVTRELPALRQ